MFAVRSSQIKEEKKRIEIDQGEQAYRVHK